MLLFYCFILDVASMHLVLHKSQNKKSPIKFKPVSRTTYYCEQTHYTTESLWNTFFSWIYLCVLAAGLSNKTPKI